MTQAVLPSAFFGWAWIGQDRSGRVTLTERKRIYVIGIEVTEVIAITLYDRAMQSVDPIVLATMLAMMFSCVLKYKYVFHNKRWL